MEMDAHLLILALGLPLAVLIPVIAYLIYTWRLRRVTIADVIASYLRGEERPLAQEERTALIREEPSISELPALVKAVSLIAFTDKDIPRSAIRSLQRKNLIEPRGRFYVVTQTALSLIEEVARVARNLTEKPISDWELDLYRHGIKALGVVHFDEREGATLVKLSDRWNLLDKLGDAMSLLMIDAESLSVSGMQAILVSVKAQGERRTTTHKIVAVSLDPEMAREYVQEHAEEILRMAQERMKRSRASDPS